MKNIYLTCSNCFLQVITIEPEDSDDVTVDVEDDDISEENGIHQVAILKIHMKDNMYCTMTVHGTKPSSF